MAFRLKSLLLLAAVLTVGGNFGNSLRAAPAGAWFFDDFSRTTLPPWTVQLGRWSLTNGTLQGTSSNQDQYAGVYVSTNWTNYSYEAQMRLPAGTVWESGIIGRLNPATGSGYAMEVIPEGSPEATGGIPMFQLMKFEGWGNWSFNPMAQTTLPPVGTNWHTLKMGFAQNHISVYFDGIQLTNVADNNFDHVAAYTNGGIGALMWMNVLFTGTYDNATVRPLVADNSFTNAENTVLSVAAPGLLANDTAVYTTNLTTVLVTGPTNGAISLSTNGAFTYTPANNYFGQDAFTYRASDGLTNLGTATVILTVTQSISIMTVNIDSKSRAYGQTNPPLTGTLTGVQSGDNITATYTTTATNNSPVGNYPIVPVFSDPNNRLGNYIIITNGGTLTVTQAVLSVTANNQARSYGAANPALTATYSGFAAGDTTSVLSGSPSLSTTATTSSPVGSYPINVSIGTLSATNYSFSFVNGTLTVNPATLTVSAINTNRIYGAANPVFTPSYSGFVNGDTTNVLSGNPSLSTTATTSSPSGSYPINVTAGTLSAANYTFSFVSGTLTVGKATLTATAVNTNRIYGAANPAFSASYSGFVNGDTTSVLSGTPSLSTTATPSSLVGSYPINISAGTLTAANYTFSFVNGTLTVNQATLTASAVNTNRVYGAANPLFTASYSGFVNGDTTNVLSGSPSLSTTATTSSPAGPYPINIGLGTLSAANYTFSFVSGTLTVGQATLTVTAVNTNRVYGAANPAFTPSYGGFANGDTTNVLSGSPSLSTAATTSSPAGSYPINAGIGTLNAANYTFSFVSSTLTVAPATLTASAINTNRVYGAANPSFNATYSGFVNGDTTSVLSGSPSFGTTATMSSPVGPYPITIGLGTLSAANYTFSFINGTLTVSPATLTVTADNQYRLNGAVNPVLTASYSGFLNGDTTSVLSGSPSLSTTAVTNSPAGAYPITVGPGTLSAANYIFNFVNGTLVVVATTGNHWYVRQGAAGANDGSDWNNAWVDVTNINWNVVLPGDSVWIAGGNYGPMNIQAEGTVSNTIYIARVRTTNTVPAIAPGWNPGFDSPVTINTISCTSDGGGDFMTIDGQVPYGGILVTNTSTGCFNATNSNDTYNINFSGDSATNVTLLNLEIAGASTTNLVFGCPPPYNGTSEGRCISFFSFTSQGHGVHVGYCQMHNMATLMLLANQSDVVIEHNIFYANVVANPAVNHPNVLVALTCTNVTFRYNMVTNWLNEGIMFNPISSDQDPCVNWFIYANLWTDSILNGGARMLETQYTTNGPIYFFNNTCVNVPLGISTNGIANNGYWTADSADSNNIYINAGNAAFIGFHTGNDDYDLTDSTITEPHSISGASSSIFVNAAAQDYHIVPALGSRFPRNNGVTLAPQYSVDFDGNIRGALDGLWDIGAYEAKYALQINAPLVVSKSGVTVTWDSLTNHLYYLQRMTSIVPPVQFINVQSNIVGQWHVTSYTDTNVSLPGPLFYRVGAQ